MRGSFLFGLTALLCACDPPAPPAGTSGQPSACGAASVTGRLPRAIAEASGIAASRRTPGIFWVHSDGRKPVLFAIDSTGRIKARVRVAGVSLVDWEDIAGGPCGNESCLFIGDIGDNHENRSRRAIYRVVEPLLTDSVTVPAVPYPFHFPDRSHDAESLFVTAEGRIHIVTKGRSGPVVVFAFPESPSPGVAVEVEPIAVVNPGPVQLADLVTGAAATPDGRFVVIRSYSAFQIYHFMAGRLTLMPGGGFNVQALPEAQGEGIDIRADGTVFLVSEESSDGRGPPVSRVQCNLPAW